MKLPVLIGLLAACGGPSAEAPLTLQLGITHAAAERELHARQFCRVQGEPASNHELYPRCDRTAAELGEAWVNATFEGDRLVELRRWERYPDDDRAIERWNEMLVARSKLSTPSDEALRHLRERGLLPAGTRSVKAFRGADGVVIGVYLLTPSPPENANVLEQVSYEK
ncbi:MAG: hypothetical protein ABI467_15310 [Kofleriaceae bacterium]